MNILETKKKSIGSTTINMQNYGVKQWIYIYIYSGYYTYENNDSDEDDDSDDDT